MPKKPGSRIKPQKAAVENETTSVENKIMTEIPAVPKEIPQTPIKSSLKKDEIILEKKEKPQVEKESFSVEAGKPKSSPDKADEKTVSNNPGGNPSKQKESLFKRFGSAIKVIKAEILVGVLGLILALGQYFHSSVTVRISVAETWRDGYTSEIRDHMSKFRFLYKKWEQNCGNDQQCLKELGESMDKLTHTSELYTVNLGEDKYIFELICEEAVPENCKTLKTDRKASLEAALKYRNRLIEGLNTAEAVKAVAESKPFFHWDIIYSDTLQGRYLDIISEIEKDMRGFIASYRRGTDERKTKAWFVLDRPESNKGTFIIFGSVTAFLILILLIIYYLKIKYRKDSNAVEADAES